jgi:hypothetical protein
MLLSRRESLQAESERSQLVPRVEEKNRTRSADAIHAQSAARETNHATRMRCGGRRKVRPHGQIFPRAPRTIVSYATPFGEWIFRNRAVAEVAAASTFTHHLGSEPALCGEVRTRSRDSAGPARQSPLAQEAPLNGGLQNCSRHLRAACRWIATFEVAGAICARSTAVVRCSVLAGNKSGPR